MKPSELLATLVEFYRDKLALMLRHQAGARRVEGYPFNNTYQYIIAREETQLSWIAAAIRDLGGTPPETANTPVIPDGKRRAQASAIFRGDSDAANEFVGRWQERVDAITNARHKGLIGVVLGETLEHARLFTQALAGRADLLGRHADGAGTPGDVLPTRWME